MLQQQTLNRKAFDCYNSAKIKVANYYHTLDFDLLRNALSDVEKSIEADPNYFDPLNYLGILYDMQGNPTKAIETFDFVYAKSLAEGMRLEIEYNRAVANYHLYSKRYIITAIAAFKKLTESSYDSVKLKAFSFAALAQCYAMMVLHLKNEASAEVEANFDWAFKASDKAFALVESKKHYLKKNVIDQCLWVAYNAKGISYMFIDDAKRDALNAVTKDTLLDHLNKAVGMFEKGLKHFPNGWALKCNIGSVYLRLGHLFMKLNDIESAIDYFAQAEKAFLEVLDKLRPNYDFAYYELGRINRFQQKSLAALDYFDKAITAGGANPNISDLTIDANKKAVLDADTAFNLVIPPTQV